MPSFRHFSHQLELAKISVHLYLNSQLSGNRLPLMKPVHRPLGSSLEWNRRPNEHPLQQIVPLPARMRPSREPSCSKTGGIHRGPVRPGEQDGAAAADQSRPREGEVGESRQEAEGGALLGQRKKQMVWGRSSRARSEKRKRGWDKVVESRQARKQSLGVCPPGAHAVSRVRGSACSPCASTPSSSRALDIRDRVQGMEGLREPEPESLVI